MNVENNSKNKPKKGIIICRVSTSEQARKGTSLESQETIGKDKATEMDVEVVKIIKEGISGERFLKENCESIFKLVEKQGITHIFVLSFDRLSRSFPYGVMVIQKLWEKGVQIVTSTFTPNPNKLNDRLQVWFSLLFAEMEHGGIHERTRRGMITKFKSGIYPLPWLPFGYERRDLKIYLKPEYKPVIRLIFKTFIRAECYDKTARIANEKYGKRMSFELKGRDIRKIVRDKTYTGYLSWGGMLFGEGDENRSREELKIIDEKVFENAQAVLRRISHRYSKANSSPVERLVEEYGMETVVGAFNLKVSCPKCDSVELQKNGEEEMNGSIRSKHICKRCGHHFRFPSEKQLKRIENLVSLPCRKCGSRDQFILEEDISGFWKLICEECSYIIFLQEYCDRRHTEEVSNNPRNNMRKKVTSSSLEKDKGKNKRGSKKIRNQMRLDSLEIVS